ncbi:MAG: hypothetical protein WC756_17050 [Taibaiella sp.]|jgi:hypothetical protein
MSSKSESTQAKNISNFTLVIDIVHSFGPTYQPSNEALFFAPLNSQNNEILALDKEFKEKHTAFSVAIDHQQLAYEGLGKLTTRVINAFKASGASAKSQETLQTITRKIKGERSEKLKPLTEGSLKEDNSISVSQLSYASRASNFAAMISFLRAEPKYNPNEADLSIAGLEEKHETLSSTYKAVSQVQAPLTTVRIRRNEALYHPETGLVNTARLIKAYAKSVFGAQSPQYKQLTAIQFKDQPN